DIGRAISWAPPYRRFTILERDGLQLFQSPFAPERQEAMGAGTQALKVGVVVVCINANHDLIRGETHVPKAPLRHCRPAPCDTSNRRTSCRQRRRNTRSNIFHRRTLSERRRDTRRRFAAGRRRKRIRRELHRQPAQCCAKTRRAAPTRLGRIRLRQPLSSSAYVSSVPCCFTRIA